MHLNDKFNNLDISS